MKVSPADPLARLAQRRARLWALMRAAGAALALLLASACGSGAQWKGTDQRSLATDPFALSLEMDPERRYFGHSVALTESAAIVGAWGDDARGEAAGAAYVFGQDEGEWRVREVLRPGREGPGQFGYELAANGDTLAIGAVFDAERGERAGAVYLFEASGGGWRQQARLLPDDAYAYYGRALELRGDTLVVGAPGPSAGYVDVLRRAGEAWTRTARLAPLDLPGHLRFGASVALAAQRLAVGAWSDDPGEPGHVFLFERQDDDWQLVDELRADGDSDFGRVLSLDGHTLAVSGSAGAYVFEAGETGWSQRGLLRADGDRPLAFAADLVISDDALYVGAPVSSASDSGGEVRVYRRVSGEWVLDETVSHEHAGFGSAVSVGRDALLVGAMGDGRSTQAFLFPLGATATRTGP